MAIVPKIRVTVAKVTEGRKGTCPLKHEVGETWLIEDPKTVSGICGLAFCSMFPIISGLQWDAQHPWAPDDVEVLSCPDAGRPVWFEVKRLKEGEV